MFKKIRNWPKQIKDIFTQPKRYFSKIVVDGDLDEPMLRAFLYGLLGGIIVFVLNLIGGAPITIESIFTALIIVPVAAVTVLFLSGGMLMLVSEITGGERDWEIAIKSLASIFFVYPLILAINALAFNCASLWLISLIVDGYILFLFYNIALYCMKGKRHNVLASIIALGFLLLCIYLTDFSDFWLGIKNADAALKCLI